MSSMWEVLSWNKRIFFVNIFLMICRNPDHDLQLWSWFEYFIKCLLMICLNPHNVMQLWWWFHRADCKSFIMTFPADSPTRRFLALLWYYSISWYGTHLSSEAQFDYTFWGICGTENVGVAPSLFIVVNVILPSTNDWL